MNLQQIESTLAEVAADLDRLTVERERLTALSKEIADLEAARRWLLAKRTQEHTTIKLSPVDLAKLTDPNGWITSAVASSPILNGL